MPKKITQQKPPQKPTPSRPYSGAKASDDAWDLIDTLRMVVYGESGTGKTTFASTFPGKGLWLVCSGGHRPGELRSIATPENKARIEAKVVQSSDKFNHYLDTLAPSKDFVVLDHVSGFQDMILAEILELDEIPVQKNWGLADQRDYGKCIQQCKTYLRKMLNLPGNVIILGQERVFGGNDDDGGDDEAFQPVVGTHVFPKLAKWLHPTVDYVVQTFVRGKYSTKKTKVAGKEVTERIRERGVEFCMRTEKHDRYITKFRVPGKPVLPDVLIDPTYDKVTAVIRGEV